MSANPHIFLQTAYQHVFTNLLLVSYTTFGSSHSLKENCVNATELPFDQYVAKFCALPRNLSFVLTNFPLAERNFEEKLPFVQANYHSIRHEISYELSSELLSKNHGNKKRNSRISLALLLHNTVRLTVLLFLLVWEFYR